MCVRITVLRDNVNRGRAALPTAHNNDFVRWRRRSVFVISFPIWIRFDLTNDLMERTRIIEMQISLRAVIQKNPHAKVKMDALTILDLIAEIDRLDIASRKKTLDDLSGKKNPLSDIFGGIFNGR